jgi:5-(carboxyamino)imidazole ribonucleotide synthase
MHQFISSDLKLGILGGGQLGKMLILSTACYDVYTRVLDPDPECASSAFCNDFVRGSFNDYDTVLAFGKGCDILTVEIEHVNTEALKALKKLGVEVHPDPEALEVIKDKGLQKEFYARHNLPTSPFFLVTGEDEIRARVEEGRLSFPFVQKTRSAGYDGKGVKVVNSREDLENLLPGPSVIEEAVKIRKELAVIVAQSSATQGIQAFDVVDMEFNAQANLVEFLFSPAQVSEAIREAAVSLAKKTLEAYNINGLLAVELFLGEDGQLLINEVAPRPHNSGHHTIDSCVTSQFEQHFRSIFNLPLGSTRSLSPAVMGNILGEEGHTGKVYYEGMEEALATEGAKFHIYGKKTTKPFRKMGHFTVVDSDLDIAIQRAKKINKALKVKTR